MTEPDARRYPGARTDPLSYPGTRPPGSYLYDRGRVRSLDGDPLDPGLLEGRIAVLAVGSNACPGRLLEKFGRGEAAVIPVLWGTWRGGLPVYLPGFAPYGALPATYWPHADAEVELWATLLDPGQLETMNRSEGIGDGGDRYKLALLEGGLALGAGRLEPVLAYRGGSALDLGEGVVPLAGFRHHGALPPARPLTQPEVLSRVLDALGHEPGAGIESRVRALGEDPALRRRLQDELRARFATVDPAFDRLPPVPSRLVPARLA